MLIFSPCSEPALFELLLSFSLPDQRLPGGRADGVLLVCEGYDRSLQNCAQRSGMFGVLHDDRQETLVNHIPQLSNEGSVLALALSTLHQDMSSREMGAIAQGVTLAQSTHAPRSVPDHMALAHALKLRQPGTCSENTESTRGNGSFKDGMPRKRTASEVLQEQHTPFSCEHVEGVTLQAPLRSGGDSRYAGI